MKKTFFLLLTFATLFIGIFFVSCNDGDDASVCSDGDHKFTVQNQCSVCGTAWSFSEGLDFSLSDDETFYSVLGIGTCTDTSVTVPYGFNGKPVKAVKNKAFNRLTSLESIILPDSITEIGADAFECCEALKNITLSNSLITIGDYAFRVCSSLTSITIPNSVTTIGQGAFGYCESLTNINIPSSVTSIGLPSFSGCTSLASFSVDESNTAYKAVAGNLYTKDGKTLIQYALAKRDEVFTVPDGVTTISHYAFADNKYLKSVVIPDSVTTIEQSAFSFCRELENVNIPSGVTTISTCTFWHCDSLTSITIPVGVTSIKDFVFESSGVKNINFSGTVAQWNAIIKSEYWDSGIQYTVNYNYTGE